MEGLVGRFEKTDAGRQEIASRAGTLDRRARAILIMVDGRTGAEDLLARANQLGLKSDAVLALQQAGLIQIVGEPDQGELLPSTGSTASARKPEMPLRKRSLASARMYLMDVIARTFGTAEHPIRARLIEATDQGSVELVFEAFLEALREAATPSVVAHIEESFRAQLPISE